MKKILKIGLIAVALLVLVGGAAAFLGYSRFRSAPAWYKPSALSPEQVEAAAKSLEDKVSRDVQNQVARLRAAEAREPSEKPADREITASFTENELNAFWQKWSASAGWAADADKYVANPVVRLADGELILAGTVNDLDTVVSLHFAPQPAADGQDATLKLAGIRGGMLPLPMGLISTQKAAVEKLLGSGSAALARRAAFAPDGAANPAAINAALADELLRLLDGESVGPVLFLPVTNAGGPPDFLPARVTSMTIADGKIDLTAKLLTPTERADLLDRLRGASPDAVAKQ